MDYRLDHRFMDLPNFLALWRQKLQRRNGVSKETTCRISRGRYTSSSYTSIKQVKKPQLLQTGNSQFLL